MINQDNIIQGNFGKNRNKPTKIASITSNTTAKKLFSELLYLKESLHPMVTLFHQ